jgi:hypothetical protein
MQRLGITSLLLVVLAGCGRSPGTERAALGVAPGASEEVLSGAPDPVVAWNVTAGQMIVGPGGAARVPVIGLVEAAMVHTAIYDAVNAIEGYPYRKYGSHPTVAHPASGYAATAAAAHDVLLALYPANGSALDAAYATSLSYVPDGEAKSHGISVGQQTAAAIVALRANDGRYAGGTFTTEGGVGVWIPTPPAFLPAQAPWGRFITPWTMTSPSQFRAKPPPSLDSETWIRDYEETKTLGAKVGSTRTPEQTDVGLFWSDQPQLQWSRAWQGIAIKQRLSVLESARLFAMVTTAFSDGLIGCWDSKYHYAFWRPVTAIRAGGGNSRLTADPDWLSNVTTPNHPEYPAAHGCASSSVTHALQAFFGTDDIPFTVDSAAAGIVQPVHSYARFSDALEEVKRARVYGGMHYRNSTEQGAKLGKKVVAHLRRHFFNESQRRDDEGDDRDDD